MTRHGLALGTLVLLLGAFGATSTHAATCTFTEDLDLGSQSEEVRCLQKYLNANGYNVATSGVGAPGQETSLYREKTQDAVRRWQVALGIKPATGTFGPLSRAMYKAMNESGVTPAVPATPATPTTPAIPATPAVPAQSQEEQEARKALTDARKQFNSANSEIDEAEEDDEDVDEAEDLMEEAVDELFNALYAYLDKDYRDAREGAFNAMDLIRSARESLDTNSGSDEDEAEEALEDAEDLISEAWEEVEEADEDGERVGEAEDLLDDAEDLLDDAQDAFDDEDYDEVMDLIDEIEDLVDEALDSI
ncbi:MAG TPA: peptidoglycan-binding protein [Candidatus Paceibacterota bacterium]|nr:peptidoglycan-binding protein [Candidatus Paceibacterota bacterium]